MLLSRCAARRGPSGTPAGGGAGHAAEVALALALGLVLAGCPDPVGDFEEFGEKLAAKPRPPTGACGAAPTEQVDGLFFTTLSTQLDKTNPALLLAQIATDGAGMRVELQPLRVADRRSPVGEPLVAPATSIDAAGRFTLVLADVVLEPAANPFTTDPIVASSLVLTGTACADFLCGDLSGQITEPAPITLEAGPSQFAMQRVAAGGAYPEPPVLNCAGELAAPLE